jgi:hypothetical protein
MPQCSFSYSPTAYSYSGPDLSVDKVSCNRSGLSSFKVPAGGAGEDSVAETAEIICLCLAYRFLEKLGVAEQFRNTMIERAQEKGSVIALVYRTLKLSTRGVKTFSHACGECSIAWRLRLSLFSANLFQIAIKTKQARPRRGSFKARLFQGDTPDILLT